MEDEVVILPITSSIKEVLGRSFIYGYATGSFIGFMTAKRNYGIVNNVTRYNMYFANLFVKGGIALYAAKKIYNKLSNWLVVLIMNKTQILIFVYLCKL